MISISGFQSSFPLQGWSLLNLPDPGPVHEARRVLAEELVRASGVDGITLETYHDHFQDDGAHTEMQMRMSDFYISRKLGRTIVEAQDNFFRGILGPDMKVQRRPYLRITRPGKPQDNVGWHRDTFYGGSPYELSFLVPFVNLPAESALSVISGSHLLAESSFATQQVKSAEVEKGSVKHRLGFLYASKVVSPEDLKGARPVPMIIGQALLFSLSLMHGSVLNAGTTTRWSSDIRVMCGLAPVDLSARPDYYERLSSSHVTDCAETYLAAQAGD